MRDVARRAGRPADRPGVNILLVGLDRRSGMTKAEKDRLHVNGEECNCTDTMMLLHLSEDRKRVSIVSIPRDSYVPFAAHREQGGKTTVRHRGKINSAYEHGGPALAVRTVEQATGVRVDHYAETDFKGFVGTVDRAGGNRVCTGKPLRDTGSGLDLAAGTHVLDGARSLRYVRARHVSPPGDLGRVRRQQRFVAHLLETLTSERVAGSPATLYGAAAALRATVRTDDTLTVGRLAGFGRELRGLRPERMEFATLPLSEFDHRVPEWGSTLKWDAPRAEVLFRNLREDRPVTGDPRTEPAPGKHPVSLPPGEVTVRVQGHGEGVRRVEQGLRDNGFDVAPRGGDGAEGTAAAPPLRTEITYAPRTEPHALALATALPGATTRAVKGHPATPLVRLSAVDGARGTRVVDVVEDRSSVEGAPVTGDAFACD
ncbi:LCP family protein [Streptomyces sp. HNM0574]|nr:LCP family protein [Streptomyces sp. HNM0574]